ncbi:MAG: protein translocase subunit SecF [Candidatus Aminicenantes bacterium]|nr:protein translocase subunit SecF [Candidatus Aminicenantes bacterium]
MKLLKATNINFMKWKFVALGVTFLIILAGLLNMTVGNGLKLGVDFGGGTLIRVVLKDSVSVSSIRDSLQSVGLGNSLIQATGKGGHEFMIRTRQVFQGKSAEEEIEAHARLADQVIAALKGSQGASEAQSGLRDINTSDRAGLTALLEKSFPGEGAALANAVIGVRDAENFLGAEVNKITGILTGYDQLQRAGIKPEVIKVLQEKTYLGPMAVVSRETVGPQAGADLRKKATLAVIWSLIGMLIYIAVRFKLAYGVAAILTLTQDVLITLALYSFTSREINLPVIAALLTIVGFSINDTIVTFDRVRENLKTSRKDSLERIMNLSINQMLGRTIITSGTVFLTVMALFLFGGEVINDFAFVMLIGVIEGVYSTLYLSCPVVILWQKLFPSKRGFRK